MEFIQPFMAEDQSPSVANRNEIEQMLFQTILNT